MPRTPENLPRHELVGLAVDVVSASNPDLVGIAGDVVLETTKTLGIESAEQRSATTRSQTGGETRVFHVPKADTTFEFEWEVPRTSEPDAARSAAEAGDRTQVVTVEGSKLVARPARRTEQTGDSQWR